MSPQPWRALLRRRRLLPWPGVLLLLLALPVLAQTNPPPRVEPAPAGPAWLAGYRLRWPLRVVGQFPSNDARQSVIALIPAGGWLKPDGSDVAIQGADGAVIPLRVLSHDPTGNTIVQFERQGTNRWYWAYGLNPNAPPLPPDPVVTPPPAPAAGAPANPAEPAANPTAAAANQPDMASPSFATRSGGIPEGLTMEVREWAGQRLDSWADAVDGLRASETVIGNGHDPVATPAAVPAGKEA